MRQSKNDLPLADKSAQLRHTLEIAALCEFDYEKHKAHNRYGGNFTVLQLEKILARIKGENHGHQNNGQG